MLIGGLWFFFFSKKLMVEGEVIFRNIYIYPQSEPALK